MAAMRTEELKGMGKLGPIGIVKEAFQIFRAHAEVFLLIQFAFMVDLVALALVANYFLLKNFPDPNKLAALFSHHHHNHFSRKFEGFFGTTSPAISMLTTILISFASGILYNGFLCLSLSATIYSVGLHYAGKAVSFLDVIRAAVPRLWMRLGVTTTYFVLVTDFIALAQMVVILLLLNGPPSLLAALASNVLVLLSVVLGMVLGVIFSVAQVVSVFEEDYGWAAMIKSLKLLKGKGKWKVGILLQLLLAVPVIIPVFLVFAFQYMIPPFDPAKHLLTVAAYTVWSTFLVQYSTLCYAVQYASFKAYHESVSIIDCISQKQTEKVGYQRIGNGTDEALLPEQEAGSNA